MAKAKTLIDRDALMCAPKKIVGDLCVHIFDRIQGRKKEHQLLALAAAFALLTDATRIEPQEVYSASKALMADPMTSSGLAPQFQAMRFHLNTEVLA